MPHDDLKKLAKESRKYLSMLPGETYVGFFIGHKVVPDKFKISEDPTAQQVEYTLQDSKGKIMKWSKPTGSKVTTDMGEIDHGSGISILMIAKGKYEIKKLDIKLPAGAQNTGEEAAPF